MATFTDKPWNGDETRWKNAAAYVQDCLIDLTPPGKPKEFQYGKLPYREPDGAVNVNAMHTIAAVLAGGMGGLTGVPPAKKREAARKLIALYRERKETPPSSLQRLAS